MTTFKKRQIRQGDWSGLGVRMWLQRNINWYYQPAAFLYLESQRKDTPTHRYLKHGKVKHFKSDSLV